MKIFWILSAGFGLELGAAIILTLMGHWWFAAFKVVCAAYVAFLAVDSYREWRGLLAEHEAEVTRREPGPPEFIKTARKRYLEALAEAEDKVGRQ